MFPQDVIDDLNQENGWYADWSDNNTTLLPMLLNPCFKLQPNLLPNVRCIMANEFQHGRFISIEYFHYKWSYLIKPCKEDTVIGWIENLVCQLNEIDGHAHMERSFLVIDLPVGHYLDINFNGPLQFSLKQIDYVDLDAV